MKILQTIDDKNADDSENLKSTAIETANKSLQTLTPGEVEVQRG